MTTILPVVVRLTRENSSGCSEVVLDESNIDTRRWKGKNQFELLADALRTNTVVTTVKFGPGNIGRKGASTVARVLRENTTIERLDLSKNAIGKDGARSIARAVQNGSALIEMNLNECFIGNEGVGELSGSLSAGDSRVAKLGLASNAIGTDGALALSEYVRKSKVLTDLNLDWNVGMGSEGMASLARGLSQSDTLVALKLNMCGLGMEGARSLEAALRTNKSLEVLDLSGNNIGEEGACLLLDAIVDHPNLRSLGLKSNGLGEDSFKAVAPFIETRSKPYVNLLFNTVTMEGSKAISAAIRKNPACTRPILRYLSTIRKRLGGDGRMVRMHPLKLFSYLTDIYIDLDEAEVQRLLLGAVYGAGIRQLLQECHKGDENYLLPHAMWRVGSKLGLDGYYEIVRSKPELFSAVDLGSSWAVACGGCS